MTKILVVDDSRVDRQLLYGLLSADPSITIVEADNGRSALELIKADPPQLVLTDLMMPEMDGIELVSTVATNYPLIPVVLITGQGSEEIAVKALQAGAAHYVPKSRLSDQLVQIVQQVLEIAQQEYTQLRLMGCLRCCTVGFELRNEIALIPPLVEYLHCNLRAIGVCDEVNAIRVCVALEEALNNAVYHGNLELLSEQREGPPEVYQRLVQERSDSQPYCERCVTVEVEVSREAAKFIIRDEGPGFDPFDIPDPTAPENLERACGRGILLMQTFMDEVQFNGVGNEVTLIKRRSGDVVPV